MALRAAAEPLPAVVATASSAASASRSVSCGSAAGVPRSAASVAQPTPIRPCRVSPESQATAISTSSRRRAAQDFGDRVALGEPARRLGGARRRGDEGGEQGGHRLIFDSAVACRHERPGVRTRRRPSGPGTGQRRPLREHQPADRRPDPRQGAAGRPPSAAALFARHAERRQGHGDARGAARARPRRRRVRRLADPDQRGRAVRQRLRRGQPELEDPGAASIAAGRRRSGCSSRARSCSTWPRSSAPSCRPAARARAECLSWLFWQMGSAPFLGGGFGHFYAYAPTKIEYAIDRYAMEVKRQLDVLDRRLAESRVPGRRRLHDRRHRRLALVRHARQGPALRRGRVPAGAGLHATSCAGPTRSRSARRCSAAAWSTAPGASRRASCTSATTRATSRRGPQDKLAPPPDAAPPRPDDDHALRLRHRAEPAPRPHPARREGRRPRDGRGRPAQRRAAGRRLPQDESAMHGAGAAHRRRPAADRQRGDHGLPRGALPGAAAARRHAARRRPRSRAGTGASSSRACWPIAEAMRNSAPAHGQPGAARAGELCADPRAGAARPGAGAAVLRDAERAPGRPRLHRRAIASASPTSRRWSPSTSRA